MQASLAIILLGYFGILHGKLDSLCYNINNNLELDRKSAPVRINPIEPPGKGYRGDKGRVRGSNAREVYLRRLEEQGRAVTSM